MEAEVEPKEESSEANEQDVELKADIKENDPNDNAPIEKPSSPSPVESESITEKYTVENAEKADETHFSTITMVDNLWYTDESQLSYIALCETMGTVPSGYFLRNMNGSSLTLRNSTYGVLRMKPIFTSLGVNTTVTTLDLSDATLGDEAIPDLCNMLKENYIITDINLAGNQLSSNCAEILCDALASATQMERIDLHQNKFCDKSAKFFAELMATSLKMSYLNLSYNNFGPVSTEAFGRALPQATSLIELDLSWNRLGSGALRLFTKGLAENKNIQILNLAFNGIGPTNGCRELANGLKGNKALLELDLSGNRLSPEGAVIFSKGLAMNSVLQKLKLTRNPLHTAGCYALLRGLMRSNKSALIELDLQGISVNDDFRQLQDTLRVQRPQLIIRAGPYTTEKTRAISSDWLAKEITPKQTIQKMGKIVKRNLVDALGRIDTKGEKRVTREAFIQQIYKYLSSIGIEFTEEQMKQLMVEVDPKKEGEIHFELLEREETEEPIAQD